MGNATGSATALKMSARAVMTMAVACATSILAGCQPRPGSSAIISPTTVKAELDASLAKGTPSSDVEAYLSSKRMPNSGIVDNAKLAHMGFDPDTFEIRSLVKDTKKSALVSTDISITFVFDRAKTLTEIRTSEVHSGP